MTAVTFSQRFPNGFPTSPSVESICGKPDRSNELIDHHDADDQCGKGLGPCTLKGVLHLTQDTQEKAGVTGHVEKSCEIPTYDLLGSCALKKESQSGRLVE